MMHRRLGHIVLIPLALVLDSCSNESADGRGGAGDSGAGSAGDSGAGDGAFGAEADAPLSRCAAEIAAGATFNCVRSSDGRVWCWGNNEKGQLTGEDLSPSVPAPRPVSGLRAPAVQLAAGAFHACAALSDDTVWCWGANDTGQLGNGTITAYESLPVQVQGLEGGVLSLAANGSTYRPSSPDNPDFPSTMMNHTCAVRLDGTVWCWGSDFTGQIGGGKKGAPPVPTPTEVNTIGTGFVQVAAGATYTCARLDKGGVECWGFDNYGQLGDGNTDYVVRSPVQVVGLDDARQVAAGVDHVCVVASDGRVWCWGENGAGQCGVEPAQPLRVTSPTVVPLSAKTTHVVAGGQHTCAVLEDGSVWCWGSNIVGELGSGKAQGGPPYEVTNVPGKVILLDDVDGLASIGYHICAVTAADQIWCWGDARHGALGNGIPNTSALPDPMPTPVKVVDYCAVSDLP